MAAIPQPNRMSVEAYLELDRNDPDHRYEYHNGAISMMSGGSADHSIIKINLTTELKHLLRGSGCHVFDSDLRVQLSATRYVYPDAMVSCDPADWGRRDTALTPLVVFEVLSPSTQAYDLGRKADLYRACSTIEEIVLIHFDHAQIDLYRRAEKFWHFQSFKVGEEVPLTSLGITLAVDALYDEIEFQPDDAP
ncbi:MAG: Uma2 family endonuclease [Ktedonobacterales bacterium]|nr:Uma2 family endonuclease [Ktedonobacterales bacterium]